MSICDQCDRPGAAPVTISVTRDFGVLAPHVDEWDMRLCPECELEMRATLARLLKGECFQ